MNACVVPVNKITLLCCLEVTIDKMREIGGMPATMWAMSGFDLISVTGFSGVCWSDSHYNSYPGGNSCPPIRQSVAAWRCRMCNFRLLQFSWCKCWKSQVSFEQEISELIKIWWIPAACSAGKHVYQTISSTIWRSGGGTQIVWCITDYVGWK